MLKLVMKKPISFIPEPESKPAGESVAPAAKDTQLVPSSPAPVFSEIEGDIQPGDYRYPRLSLIHGVDSRSAEFKVGTFVYATIDGQMFQLDPPLMVVPVRLKLGFIERAELGEIPRVIWSQEDLEEIGGSVDFEPPLGRTPFSRFSDNLVLIECAKDPLKIAEIVIGETKYAACVYRTKATAFVGVGSVWVTWNRQKPGRHLTQAAWELNVREALRPRSTTKYLVPYVKLSRFHSDGEIAALADVAPNL